MFFFQPCVATDPLPGDGIDNDCDGKNDEELENEEGKLLKKLYIKK